ncbi:MAG TPA: peptidylprolyl isomerase [Tepidiformaceae bacterium]|nr:peptidylprolyl isomerase [Tepidiformaceae bacterium]
MARRERTTGLPRQPRQVRRVHTGRTFLGVPINDATIRLGVLGFAGALLIVVTGLLGWQWYSNTFVRPDKVVLSVGDRETSLRYYADRLYQFSLANPTVTATLSQQLLNKLQEEDVTVLLARQEGIDLSEDAITRAIGLDLAGADATEPLTGADYLQALKTRLDTLGYSESVYRRIYEASLANDGLIEQFKTEIGDTAESVSYRVVAVETEDEANEVLDLVRGGDSIGTIAQARSLDVESRQNDGLVEAQPLELLPEAFIAAFEGKVAGDLLDPFEVEGVWFAIQVETIDPEGALDDAKKTDLAQKRLDEAIAEHQTLLTSQGQITRDLSAGDFEWAVDHLKTGSGS